jgi:hypothetical protein
MSVPIPPPGRISDRRLPSRRDSSDGNVAPGRGARFRQRLQEVCAAAPPHGRFVHISDCCARGERPRGCRADLARSRGGSLDHLVGAGEEE